MKPISKKVIEAGLVPKHTLLLMQRWGYFEPEAAANVPTQVLSTEIKESFTRFVEELDELLEAKTDEDIKETRFSITLQNPFRIVWLYEKNGNYLKTKDDPLVIFEDGAGNLIFPPSSGNPLDRIFEELNTKDWYTVKSSTPLWYGDTLYAYQAEVETFR